MSSDIFRFKQFSVSQVNCAMKVNTDGVLLGALAGAGVSQKILDIGTGTGVVALMMAQRFSGSVVDAVEIDEQAAGTARANFEKSPFADKLHLYPQSFQQFSGNYPENKYDLIVSNPPFFLDSLKNPDKQKETARHTTGSFFTELILFADRHLTKTGELILILPPQTADLCLQLAGAQKLFPSKIISIASFYHSKPHRVLISFSRTEQELAEEIFVIYAEQKQYSLQYIETLKNFLTIF